MKKLLALGILATALPLGMQQNVNNDVLNVLNDTIEQNPDLCALGYETYEGSIVLCDQIDFTLIGSNSKYPGNGKYVLGKDITFSSYTTTNISFNGTIDGRGKVITFTNRIEPLGDNATDFKMGLFAYVVAGAKFSNLEIYHSNASYSGRTARTDYGSLAARAIIDNGSVDVDNVKIRTNLTNSNNQEANYGGLFGYATIGSNTSTAKSSLNIANSTISSAAAFTYTAAPQAWGGYMGGLIGYAIIRGNGALAGSLNVANNQITSVNRVTETTSTYSGGLVGQLETSNVTSVNSGTSLKFENNNITHSDNLGAISNDIQTSSYNSGAFVGRTDITHSKLEYTRNVINNTVTTSTTVYRINAGGVFGYSNVGGVSEVSANDNQVKFTGTFTNTSSRIYAGGITGVNVNGNTSISNINDMFLDTNIVANGNSTLAITGGIIGNDNTGSSATSNYNGIVIVGQLTNNATTDIAVAGLIAYVETNGERSSFKNVLVANTVTSTSGGSSIKYVGDIFGKMTGNAPLNQMAYFLTTKATSQFEVVTKEEITYEFLTVKEDVSRIQARGMSLKMDVWQIQPYTQFISDSGTLQLFLRIDSRVDGVINADNGSAWAPVIDLDKFVRQQSINWWFIIGIAAIGGFVFWLYTWNKNRRRYN